MNADTLRQSTAREKMEQTELKAERQGPQTSLGTWHPYLPVLPLYVGSASWSFLAHAFGWVSLLAAFSSLALVSGLVFALCPRSWLAPHPPAVGHCIQRRSRQWPSFLLHGHYPIPCAVPGPSASPLSLRQAAVTAAGPSPQQCSQMMLHWKKSI